MVAHLKINSLRIKFDSLVEKIKVNVNILMISETKLDNSFPEGQFLTKGYSKPYRIDRYRNAICKSRFSIKIFIYRVEINLQKKTVAMLFVQPK